MILIDVGKSRKESTKATSTIINCLLWTIIEWLKNRPSKVKSLRKELENEWEHTENSNTSVTNPKKYIYKW